MSTLPAPGCFKLTTETLGWLGEVTMLDLLEDEDLSLLLPPEDPEVAKWSWLLDRFLISICTLLEGSDLFTADG